MAFAKFVVVIVAFLFASEVFGVYTDQRDILSPESMPFTGKVIMLWYVFCSCQIDEKNNNLIKFQRNLKSMFQFFYFKKINDPLLYKKLSLYVMILFKCFGTIVRRFL